VIADVGVSFTLVPLECTDTCCTKAGGEPAADAPAEAKTAASRRPAVNVVKSVMVSLRGMAVPGPPSSQRVSRARQIGCLSIYVVTAPSRAFMALNFAFRRLNALVILDGSAARLAE
jgi:hypothetical protein